MLFYLKLIIFAVILLFLLYFLIKKDNFCENIFDLKNLIYNKNLQTKYISLRKTIIDFKIKSIINSKTKRMYFEKDFIDNKDIILKISECVSNKINNSNQLYKAKSKITNIENVAYIVSKTIHSNNPYLLFSKYKNIKTFIKINKKEDKIFKLLLAKFLLEELVKIEDEFIQISKIIQNNKNRNYFTFYLKNINNTAKYYSILRYYKNSTMYFYKKKIDKVSLINNLFDELNYSNFRMRIIIKYLSVMFKFWFHFTFQYIICYYIKDKLVGVFYG